MLLPQHLVVAGQSTFYKNEHVFVGSKKDIYVVCFLLHFLSLNGNCQDKYSKHWEKKPYFYNIFINIFLEGEKLKAQNNSSIVC